MRGCKRVCQRERSHLGNTLEDRVTELLEHRSADRMPIVLAEEEGAILMRRRVGDVEGGLSRTQSA